jgi:predicted nucleotidyltransferase
MFLSKKVKKQLVDRLVKINPYRIVLFGSYAYGKPGNDSDVDLLVVTEDNYLPKNFKEKNALYLRVSNTITDIEKKIPIDLIVHTKPMYKMFIEMGSMFSKRISTKGIVLYEKPD